MFTSRSSESKLFARGGTVAGAESSTDETATISRPTGLESLLGDGISSEGETSSPSGLYVN